MGNGASSTVRPIHLNPDLQNTLKNTTIDTTRVPDMCFSDSSDRIKDKLSEARTNSLELLERNADLQNQLEDLRNNSLSKNSNTQEQYIRRLEQEIKYSKEQIVSLKQKHKRKMKKLKTEFLQAKQETSIMAFEMREKIQTLQEHRHFTRAMEDSCEKLIEQHSGDDGRVHLILELSNQVSQQQEKIECLQAAMKQKDMHLRKLEGQQLNFIADSGLLQKSIISVVPPISSQKEQSYNPEHTSSTPRIVCTCPSHENPLEIKSPPCDKTLQYTCTFGWNQVPALGSEEAYNTELKKTAVDIAAPEKDHRISSGSSTESGVSMS
ncbi:coiled-coil domain-containing protein 192-like isoform X2 [Lepisosteus oculatus]|uniref:coiled-coil domain-containing protein 192-like isoform X2 n=1 Tax=Lepisosteus oculatus TaxID=7918 RepID=UPI003713C728